MMTREPGAVNGRSSGRNRLTASHAGRYRAVTRIVSGGDMSVPGQLTKDKFGYSVPVDAPFSTSHFRCITKTPAS